MPTLDERTVVELVRARLGILDGSQNARITWCIPHALDRLARKIAQNPRKRSLFLTPKQTTSAAITLIGSLRGVDLAALIASGKDILIEYLHHGHIFIDSTFLGLGTGDVAEQYPLVQISASDHLNHLPNHPLRYDYVFYWLDGTNLLLTNFGDNVTIAGGTLFFNVPYRPTLGELSGITDLHDELVDKVIELLSNPTLDLAEDAEH